MRRPAGKYGKPGWYVSIWCLARCRSMSGGYRGLLVHVHGPPRVILFRQEPLKVSPSLIGPPASRSQFRLSYRSPKDKLGRPERCALASPLSLRFAPRNAICTLRLNARRGPQSRPRKTGCSIRAFAPPQGPHPLPDRPGGL
jgi:hypothetical protein